MWLNESMKLIRTHKDRYTVTTPNAEFGGINVVGFVTRFHGWWVPTDYYRQQIGDSRRTPREAAALLVGR